MFVKIAPPVEILYISVAFSSTINKSNVVLLSNLIVEFDNEDKVIVWFSIVTADINGIKVKTIKK